MTPEPLNQVLRFFWRGVYIKTNEAGGAFGMSSWAWGNRCVPLLADNTEVIYMAIGIAEIFYCNWN